MQQDSWNSIRNESLHRASTPILISVLEKEVNLHGRRINCYCNFHFFLKRWIEIKIKQRNKELIKEEFLEIEIKRVQLLGLLGNSKYLVSGQKGRKK